MLDYKSILVKKLALHMTSREIAEEMGCSKTGINDFLSAFGRCKDLSFPLPQEITNEGIYEAVYGRPSSDKGSRDASYKYPDYEDVHKELKRKNMTLLFQWGAYKNACLASSEKPYSYRQFCSLYQSWCEENDLSPRFEHVPGQVMEVDFAGKTFKYADPLDGVVHDIVVFVAVLPYSQYVYAEGMISTKEPEWIEANNNALAYFQGVPQIVVCDNCKQAVVANKDWIQPGLNRDYAEWASHNGTAIMAAKVKKPKYKPSVEGAVGILEKGLFHELDGIVWTSLDDFNRALWKRLERLNSKEFEKKEHSRRYYFEEEKKWLLPLPQTKYRYAERREATVSSDYHIRFDNAYYSCPSKYVHEKVVVRATSDSVAILDMRGSEIFVHRRATARGQWVTEPSHIPPGYNGYKDWSPDFFERKAALVGPSTLKVIEAILSSKKYQVQTFRLCRGVLSFEDKYGADVLEWACAIAYKLGKPNYTFVKNLLSSRETSAAKKASDRNKNAYLAPSGKADVDALIAKTQSMMSKKGGSGDE